MVELICHLLTVYFMAVGKPIHNSLGWLSLLPFSCLFLDLLVKAGLVAVETFYSSLSWYHCWAVDVFKLILLRNGTKGLTGIWRWSWCCHSWGRQYWYLAVNLCRKVSWTFYKKVGQHQYYLWRMKCTFLNNSDGFFFPCMLTYFKTILRLVMWLLSHSLFIIIIYIKNYI